MTSILQKSRAGQVVFLSPRMRWIKPEDEDLLKLVNDGLQFTFPGNRVARETFASQFQANFAPKPVTHVSAETLLRSEPPRYVDRLGRKSGGVVKTKPRSLLDMLGATRRIVTSKERQKKTVTPPAPVDPPAPSAPLEGTASDFWEG